MGGVYIPLRGRALVVKSIASFVLFAFLALVLEPLAIAAHIPSPQQFSKPAPSPEEKLETTLSDIGRQLTQFDKKLANKEDTEKEQNSLHELRLNLELLDKETLDHFAQIGERLKEKQLPQVILDRQRQAVEKYKAEMAALNANLKAVEQAKGDSERRVQVKKAKTEFEAKLHKRKQSSFDPNDFPFRVLKRNPKNVPKIDRKSFRTAGLFDNPYPQLAALGDYRYDNLVDANDPAYLAATNEIVLTPAIRTKAAELQYDPVLIYNWVRNNIAWIPTWGATQDADLTLGSRCGNAMDIASLLIALYRASGIPARYVHGTIEVAADKFMNWVGSFNNINAALSYASKGGIPVTAIVSGGTIVKVQLEHIWVEAALDFYPSRGAVNKSADSWVQIDPSYKQYDYLQGLDALSISGINADTVSQSFVTSGTINATEGWVQNLDGTILQNAQNAARTAFEAYITNNMPNATFADVVGGQKILASNSRLLPTALPYSTVAIGARYGTLPTALENRATFGLGTDPSGMPVNPVTLPWSSLNNHKITLSFKPATAADEQTITSLLPAGPISDPSQLPQSVPAYLINVVPQLAVDGNVVAEGNAMSLGDDLLFHYGISCVDSSQNQEYSYPVPAGSFESVMIGGGSVSSKRIQDLSEKIKATQSKFNSGDTALINTVSREDILGDMFYAGTLGYFSQNFVFSNVASISHKVASNVPFAYGTFGHEPVVQNLFGIPVAISPGGLVMNVRLSRATEALTGDAETSRNFNLRAGILSSELENGVPEQMYSTTGAPVQGVSAAQLLEVASQQGQRIYHMTAANQASVLPNLHLDSAAIDEMTAALASGKEVIAHPDRLTVAGWTGEGYILFDPLTGSGAYKITGGANGGYLFLLAQAATAVAHLAVYAFFVSLLAPEAIIGAWFVAIAILFAGLITYIARTFDEQATDGRYHVSESMIEIAEIWPHLFTKYGPLVYLIEQVLSVRSWS